VSFKQEKCLSAILYQKIKGILMGFEWNLMERRNKKPGVKLNCLFLYIFHELAVLSLPHHGVCLSMDKATWPTYT
jgi:hypothetical protein